MEISPPPPPVHPLNASMTTESISLSKHSKGLWPHQIIQTEGYVVEGRTKFQVNGRTGKMKTSYPKYLYILLSRNNNTSGQQAELGGYKRKVTEG